MLLRCCHWSHLYRYWRIGRLAPTARARDGAWLARPGRAVADSDTRSRSFDTRDPGPERERERERERCQTLAATCWTSLTRCSSWSLKRSKLESNLCLPYSISLLITKQDRALKHRKKGSTSIDGWMNIVIRNQDCCNFPACLLQSLLWVIVTHPEQIITGMRLTKCSICTKLQIFSLAINCNLWAQSN